jgi:pilus assembly protein CpaE
MSETDGKIRILPYIKSPNILELVKKSIKNEDEYFLIDQPGMEAGLQPAIAGSKSDILLIEFDVNGAETYKIIDDMAAQFPEVAVVVILQASTDISDGLILSGATAFIQFPFTKTKLLTTFKRVVELIKRKMPVPISQDLKGTLPGKPEKIFTVFSPKGGAGCTTIAVNLAITLQQLKKEPVLLIDGKPIFGDVALMLNIRTSNSITDLISHADMLDAKLIGQVVAEHASGIKVLPSPTTPTAAQEINPDDLYKVITELQSIYPVIIVDGGNYLHETTVTILDASDKIIVVINPNLASIKDVRQFIGICQMLSYPPEKIMFVLNNTGHRTDIPHAEIENILKQKIAFDIHADDRLFPASLNEGVPAALKNPRHPANKAMLKLAEEIMNEIAKKDGADKSFDKRPNSETVLGSNIK